MPSNGSAERLGEVLLQMDAVRRGALARALLDSRMMHAPLGRILLRAGAVSEPALLDALARQHGLGQAGPAPEGAAAEAQARLLPLADALRHRALPWGRIAGLNVIATARPRRVAALDARLPAALRPCRFVVADESAIDARLQRLHASELGRRAECGVSAARSCRDWARSRAAWAIPAAIGATAVAGLLAPGPVLGVLTAVALLAAALNLALRGLALLALRRGRAADGPAFATGRRAARPHARLPGITMLVPLHDEPDIVAPLRARLERLDYPRALLDVLLVVEADDRATLDALDAAPLPDWMRVIAVPPGEPRTKPRAMNYALNFVRGAIVGVWDAEDAPAPDQLRRVAARFAAAPPEVVCLQGKLDFYNARHNWMARCFAIDYATWFRLLLPGIERMGLAIPLGGTTLFFRRGALERLGGWDAHNVTEDADLGIRLAREGYRAEVLDTTTMEEANAAALPWVKQRSRWMKGYVMTWVVHMRAPRRLLRDLGPWRFLGVQWLFGGTVLNALLLPFAWTPLVMAFGVGHPLGAWLPDGAAPWLAGAVFAITLGNVALAAAACRAPEHRHLRPWTLTLEAYFPLATLAIWKAMFELATNPFHWDKTAHGAYGGAAQAEPDLLAGVSAAAPAPAPAGVPALARPA